MGSTSRHVIRVLLLAVLLSTLLPAGGCESGLSPEEVVREALAAMEDMDAEDMAIYFTKDTREELIQSINDFVNAIDRMEIYNLDISVISQTEDQAIVNGEWDIDVTRSDVTQSDHMEQTVDLVNIEGEWLISNLSLLE